MSVLFVFGLKWLLCIRGWIEKSSEAKMFPLWWIFRPGGSNHIVYFGSYLSSVSQPSQDSKALLYTGRRASFLLTIEAKLKRCHSLLTTDYRVRVFSAVRQELCDLLHASLEDLLHLPTLFWLLTLKLLLKILQFASAGNKKPNYQTLLQKWKKHSCNTTKKLWLILFTLNFFDLVQQYD